MKYLFENIMQRINKGGFYEPERKKRIFTEKIDRREQSVY